MKYLPLAAILICTAGCGIFGGSDSEPASKPAGADPRDAERTEIRNKIEAKKVDLAQVDADLIAFPGHKNLLGPMGTGALYVRPGIQIRFFREGGSGFKAEQEVHPEEMPFRLEGGTPNAHGYAGLLAGVEFVEREGIAKIRDHERRLALRFADGLRENPKVTLYSGRSRDRQLGPVSLSIRGALPADVGRIMDETYGIACRPGIHCAPGTHRFLGTMPHGTVRFSFGYFNTDADADLAVRAVNEVSTKY